MNKHQLKAAIVEFALASDARIEEVIAEFEAKAKDSSEHVIARAAYGRQADKGRAVLAFRRGEAL